MIDGGELDVEGMFAETFSRLAALDEFKRTDRWLPHWTDVDQTSQPAAFLVGENQIPEQDLGNPEKWSIKAAIYILFRTENRETVAPMTTANALIKAVKGIFRQVPGEGSRGNDPGPYATTLGGRCERAWIGGPVEIEADGAVDNQGFIKIPVDILAAA